MNKVLHVLVYLVLIAAGVALYFEVQLYQKRELLGDRNRLLEDYVVKFAKTIEKSDAVKPASAAEARKDVSPVEAKLVESPDMENVLEEYPLQRETANLETFDWDNDAARLQLRHIYMLQDGEPVPDSVNPGKFVMKGAGTMAELLDQLFDRAKAQQANLNSTRAALADARGKIEELAADYNKLKPPARQDKVTIEELKGKIEEAEKARDAAVEEKNKIKGQIDELNAEVTSLKDEVSTAKEETEAEKEKVVKAEAEKKQLQELLKRQAAAMASGAAGGAAGGAAISSMTAGVKGKIVQVDNNLMFAIVEFSDDGIKELLGPERQNMLPLLELGVRRAGFKGPAGEYVGKIKLRQAVAGKNFVVVDVLGDWQQAPLAKGDAVFAE